MTNTSPVNKLKNNLSITFGQWTVPLALLAGVVLSYGLYIAWWGLYGDDWIYLYAYHVDGPGFFFQFVAWDRPFSAWIYVLTTSLFAENVWMYHIFLLFLRWLSAVLVWWVLGLLWQNHNKQIAAVAFLFAVYPGFKQQAIPLQFMLHFSSLDLFLLSLGLMLLSVHATGWKKNLWVVLGMLCAFGGIFPIEYYFGLEFLRPIFLWMAFNHKKISIRTKLKNVLKYWLPYLLVVIAFIIWRIFIFGFPSYAPIEMNSPVQMATGLLHEIAEDIGVVLLGAWGQTFRFPEINSSGMRYYALVLISFIFLAIYLSNLKQDEKNSQPNTPSNNINWGLQSLLIGVYALLLAGWPFWLTGLPVELDFPWDRPSLSFMLGVSLVLVGIVDVFIRNRFQMIILAALFGLAVGSQYQNARFFYIERLNIESFFWQLSWRAPGIKPGTLLLYDQLKLNSVSDNDLTPALNWMFAPESRSRTVPFKFFDLDLRYQTNITGLEEFKDGVPLEHTNRSLKFEGNTSQALSIYFNSSACLRVLSKGDENLPDLTPLLVKSLEISHPEQIIVDAETPQFPSFMGDEPEKSWCYYFQKADLARQQKDWKKVVSLADEVFSTSYAPVDKTEYIPFIEGYVHTGNWEQAERLTIDAAESDIAYRPALCSIWQRISKELEGSDEIDAKILDLSTKTGCEANPSN